MDDDKYKALFDFELQLHQEAIERYRELDQKIIRMMTAYSLLVGLFGLLWLNLRALPCKAPGLSDTAPLVLVTSLLAIGVLAVGWLRLFKALRVDSLRRFDQNAMIPFFEQHDLASVREALARSAAEMTTCNLEAANHKTEAISFAHGLTPWELLLFGLSLLLAVPGLVN